MSPSAIHPGHARADHAAPARTPRAPYSAQGRLAMTIRMNSASRRLDAHAYAVPVVRELPRPLAAPGGECTW